MKNNFSSLLVTLGITFLFLSVSQDLHAQVPTCDPSVPFYQVDLTGNPDSIWYSPGHIRNGNCCATLPPDRCTSFEVIVDTGAAMINFNIASGAIPSGAMFYQINCGPPVAVGQPICISGPGPHHITFCKPGNNQNTYFIQSIPKPTFPPPQHIRIGCLQQISVLGFDSSSVTWTSIYPGIPGQYNSYLSCTAACTDPIYTPTANAPAYIDYKICGVPIATACGYTAVCDTIRIYNEPPLTATVNPSPATFCANGSGVVLSVSASGGYGGYTFIWRDQSNVIVGTGASYTATYAGIFSVEVRDALYNSATCPSIFISVPVSIVNLPVVNAGIDQTLCATSPTAYLNGSVQFATGGIWSGGAGTFDPNNTNLQASYTPTAAEIASGQVTLTLTSTGAGGGCANITDVVVISFPPQPTVSLYNVNIPCSNANTILTPTLSGGIGPYTYTWSNGYTGSSVTVGQGNYCVGISDSLGCPASACANVIAPSPLTLIMSSTIVSVNGGSDGTATGTPGGGTPPYSYSWSPGGQTTQTATGLSFGIYTVTVTDANGCIIYASVVVNEPRCLSFTGSVSMDDVLCFGETTGSATVTLSGGTGPYTYNWNDPLNQTGPVASGLGAGTYLLAASDQNGCLFSIAVVILEPTQFTNAMNQVNVSAIGANDGSANASPSGGTPGYSYNWNTGETTSGIGPLGVGTYILTITDSNSCQFIDSVFISEPGCQNLVLSATVTPVSCNGGNNGSITVMPLHGLAPYTFLWSTGDTISTLTNLGAGTYVVTVTDAIKCTTFKNITIVEPSAVSIALAPTAISCNALDDGTIELTVSGGTFPYSFNWSNGITVEDLINLQDGTYSVTVTDAKGCTDTASATIVRPDQLVLSNTFTTVTCNGGNNGSIDLTITGGVFPYSYAWNNGSTSEDLSGLGSGQYSVTVTDANGCSINSPLGILIDEPEPVAVLSSVVACAVPGSGVATVSVTPGGGWQNLYEVSFDGGITYQPAGTYTINLPVNNTYIILVKDSNNCLAPLADTISINPEPAISALDFTKCFYGTDTSGQVTITPVGGNGGPYNVSFDGGITYQPAGTYTLNLAIDSTYSILVKDSDNCVSLSSIITLPAILANTFTLSSYNGYNLMCNGSTNGSIIITTYGGTAPYTYNWSNGSGSQSQIGLSGGNYSLVVSDTNNCADTLNFILTEPPLLNSAINSTSNYNNFEVSCAGLTDGNIGLTVSGGVPTYTYQWSNGATTEDQSGVGAGTYSVIITDANNCTDTAQVTLTEPPALTSTLVATSNYNGYNISCFGLSNGSVDLTINGGVTTYTYSWSNGAASEDQSGIGAGIYSVIITDANNCTDTAAITLTQPPVLAAALDSLSNYNGYNISCAGLSNGSITISVNGGVTAYSYNWSNGAVSEDLMGLGQGTYSVVISDANNCKDTLSFILTEPPILSSAINSTSNYNNFEVSCAGLTDGNIGLTVSGGVPTYTYQWSNGATTEDQSGVGAGTYSVVITDANNCTDTAQVTLTEPPALTSTLVATSNYNGYNISCFGLSNGAIDLTATGGVPTYSYTWSNGASGEDQSGIGAGAYSVIITDANNCTDTAAITLTQPPVLAAALDSLSNYNGYNISCAGLSNGSITISVNGGVTAYSYNWSNGAVSEDLMSLGQGTYSVVITDANNCKDTISVTLTEPLPLSASGNISTNYNGFSVSCHGSTDGAILTNVSGGTPGYTYNWSNGSNLPNQAGIGAGTYSVAITDLNGCPATLSFVLNQPDSLASTAIIQHVLCNGFSNGTIDQSVWGGVTPLSYNWSNGAATEDVAGLSSGLFSVTIIDQNGCLKINNYVVSETSAVVVATSQNNVSCNGAANAGIVATVSGGTPQYTYQWSNGSTQAQLSNLSPGVYVLVVSDINNCVETETVTLTEPAVIGGTISSPVLGNGHNVSFNNSSDGSITSTISGGTAPYTYNWSNGATSADLTNVAAGTYTLLVTDANGCMFVASAILTEPLVLEMPSGISPNGDALNDQFVVHGLEAYPVNTISIYNRWGNLVFEKDHYANNWEGETNDGATLPDGTYFVVLQINGGDITLKGYVDVRH